MGERLAVGSAGAVLVGDLVRKGKPGEVVRCAGVSDDGASVEDRAGSWFVSRLAARSASFVSAFVS